MDGNIVIINSLHLDPILLMFIQRHLNASRFGTDRNDTLKGFRKVTAHEREARKINARTLGPNHTTPVLAL